MGLLQKMGRIFLQIAFCLCLMQLTAVAQEVELKIQPEEEKPIKYRMKTLTALDITTTIKATNLIPNVREIDKVDANQFSQKFYSLIESEFESSASNVFENEASFSTTYTKFAILSKMIHDGKVSKGKIEADKKTTWVFPPRFFSNPIDEVGDKRIYSFVGQEVGFVVDLQGNVKSVSRPEKMVKMTREWHSAAPGTAAEFPISFPKGVVKPGDTWPLLRTMSFSGSGANDGPRKLELTCKYDGKAVFNGIQAYKITINTAFSGGSKDDEKNPPVRFRNPLGTAFDGMVKIQIDAVYYYDIKTCLLMGGECKYTQTLDMWLPLSKRVEEKPGLAKSKLFSVDSDRRIVITSRIAIAQQRLLAKDKSIFNFDMPADEKKEDTDEKKEEEKKQDKDEGVFGDE